MTSQNITIRPLKPGVIFSGKLYFHKISEKELRQLIWLLNAGDAEALDKKKYGYKLGAAKPLGLGSIASSVDKVTLRKVTWVDDEIHKIETDYDWKLGIDGLFSEQVVKDFRQITDFNAVSGENVCYPGQQDGSKEGFCSTQQK